MICCRIGDPEQAPGWKKRVCDIEVLEQAPADPLQFDHPLWSEDRIEWSLLRQHSVLTKLFGIDSSTVPLVLRQVSAIDLFVRAGRDLHLVELKGLKGKAPFKQWESALTQIVKYWCQLGQWLRHDAEHVHLWALCPIRWSASEGVARVPKDWKSTIKDLKQSRLTGSHPADLHLAFYSLFQDSSGRLLLMWRAEEETPRLNLTPGGRLR